MLSDETLAQSICAYAHTVELAIKAAKKLKLPVPTTISFSTRSLTEERINELANGVVTGQCKIDSGSEFLYLFSLGPKNKTSVSTAMSAFDRARVRQSSKDYTGKKNLCRSNHRTPDSTVLYVGRSYSPRERFKQHLRSTVGGTYAIHFLEWASNLNLQVDYRLYQLRDVEDKVAQVIEDGLWDHLKPLLGRRGEK